MKKIGRDELQLVGGAWRGYRFFPGRLSDSSQRGDRILSRRDYRTQPGVLTPGNMPTQCPALKGAEDIYDGRFIWSAPPHPMHRFYRPYRAGRLMNRHPGVKTPG
jgi:hypothetical protein